MQTKVLIVAALLSLCGVQAYKTFSCRDADIASCKNHFGLEFDSRFRRLYIREMSGFFALCVDIVKQIEPMVEPDDVLVRIVVDNTWKILNDVIEHLQKDANGEDFEMIVKLVNSGFENLSWGPLVANKFKSKLESIEAEKQLTHYIKKLPIKIGNLWSGMYRGLRSQDIKAYPEYKEVNDLMERLRAPNSAESKMGDYQDVVKILAEDFDLYAFKLMPEIF